MKKKVLKILAFLTALALIAGIVLFSTALMGNPVSRFLARRTAVRHLKETYPGTDYYIEDVNYDFKTSGYYARISSPTSIDTRFTLYFDMLGHLKYDSYDQVAGGFVTARRLDAEYRELTDGVFNSPSFPYDCDIDFGMLSIYPQADIEGSDPFDIPVHTILVEELVLDGSYDIRELGRRAGHLIIYVNSDEVTAEKAAEIIVRIRQIFDDAGVTFAEMDFTLEHPKPMEGMRNEETVSARGIAYGDIREDGMAERVEAADKALNAYYAEQDAQNKKG